MTIPGKPGNSSNFASVKLSEALVQQARQAAQPLRRSVAGQIEYWATLGRVVEHSGLTVQEVRNVIENYEAAALEARKKTEMAAVDTAPDCLASIRRRVLAASADGSLQRAIQRIVADNRQKAELRKVA